MRETVSVKAFVHKLSKYYPVVNYRRAIEWIRVEKLPIWPRLHQEHYSINIGKVRPLLEELKLNSKEIESFLAEVRT